MEQSRKLFEAATSAQANGFHFMACFGYHQSVEMALKAGLEREAVDHFGHALPALYRSLCRVRRVEVSDVLERVARRLNEHYISTRYPDSERGGVPAEKYAEPQSAQAQADARLILEFVTGSHDDAERS